MQSLAGCRSMWLPEARSPVPSGKIGRAQAIAMSRRLNGRDDIYDHSRRRQTPAHFRVTGIQEYGHSKKFEKRPLCPAERTLIQLSARLYCWTAGTFHRKCLYRLSSWMSATRNNKPCQNCWSDKKYFVGQDRPRKRIVWGGNWTRL